MSETRPLVTLALCTYNQEAFVEAALRAAAAQTYEPLEIIVADDASTDRTADVIRSVLPTLAPRHEIRFLVSAQNGGLASSINRVMAVSRGELIVIAAGDDVSLPHRVERLVDRWVEGAGRTHSVFSNGWVTDEDDRRLRLFYSSVPDPAQHSLERIVREGSTLLGAAHAWDRRVFDVFGPLPTGIVYEDWAIALRSALLGTVDYVDEPLVEYRRHAGNLFLGSGAVDVGFAAWRHAQRRQAEYALAAMHSWLHDLDIAERGIPSLARRIPALRDVVRVRIREAEDRLTLLRGAPISRRLTATVRQAAAGMPPRRLAQWVMTFFMPRLYFRRLCRIAAREAVEGSATSREMAAASGEQSLSASHA